MNIKIKLYHYYLFFSYVCLSFCFSEDVNIIDSQITKNTKFEFVKEIYADSWALIIGINDYQNVEPLTYATPDAESVKELFLKKYGFKEENILLITDANATKENILDGFSDILQRAKEKDRVVVFFAGHGETYKLPSGGDMGYLIPVDGNLENLYRSSIPMKSIYDIAEMSYAKHILYLVDACYGGLAMNTRGLKKLATPEYLQQMTRERGRQVITAGGRGEQVIEKPEWGHSAFTRNLLKGLGDELADENSDGVITADELGGFIRNRVPIDSDGAHTPQKGRIGSDQGEFVFISETLSESLDESVSDNTELLEMEERMAMLEDLLNKQKQDITSNNKKKAKNISIRRTATMKALLFPGRGHFHIGKKGKGFMFSGLELASLSGLAFFASSYGTTLDEVNSTQSAYENLRSQFFNGGDISGSQLQQAESAYNQAVSSHYLSQNGMGISAASALIVWFWNILDVRKQAATGYAETNPISLGFSNKGQVQIRLSF